MIIFKSTLGMKKMIEKAKRMLNKTIKERCRNTWFIEVYSNKAMYSSPLHNSKGFH